MIQMLNHFSITKIDIYIEQNSLYDQGMTHTIWLLAETEICVDQERKGTGDESHDDEEKDKQAVFLWVDIHVEQQLSKPGEGTLDDQSTDHTILL